jgi:hypothetical protein
LHPLSLYKQIGLFLILTKTIARGGFGVRPTDFQDNDRERRQTLPGASENFLAGEASELAARAFRAGRFQGTHTIFDEEAHPPYERSQLSKDILRAGVWSDAFDIGLETGSLVTNFDANRRRRTGLTGWVAGLARSVAEHNITNISLLPAVFRYRPVEIESGRVRRQFLTQRRGRYRRGLKYEPTKWPGCPDELGSTCAFKYLAQPGCITAQDVPD